MFLIAILTFSIVFMFFLNRIGYYGYAPSDIWVLWGHFLQFDRSIFRSLLACWHLLLILFLDYKRLRKRSGPSMIWCKHLRMTTIDCFVWIFDDFVWESIYWPLDTAIIRAVAAIVRVVKLLLHFLFKCFVFIFCHIQRLQNSLIQLKGIL